MLSPNFAYAVASHISFLDRELMKLFREARRVQAGKRAGARERLDELCEEAGHLLDMQERWKAAAASHARPLSSGN